MGSLDANSNFIEFSRIADEAIGFIKSTQRPLLLQEITDHFSDSDFRIPIGRVLLQLLADRKLYLTEDRRFAVSN